MFSDWLIIVRGPDNVFRLTDNSRGPVHVFRLITVRDPLPLPPSPPHPPSPPPKAHTLCCIHYSSKEHELIPVSWYLFILSANKQSSWGAVGCFWYLLIPALTFTYLIAWLTVGAPCRFYNQLLPLLTVLCFPHYDIPFKASPLFDVVFPSFPLSASSSPSLSCSL